MKTAMQELIDELESIKGYKYGGLVIRLMKEKLEKEKDWIIHTYWVAYKEGRYSGDKTAEEYYNETFNK
jgi:hypothetical protein